ncbi:AAA family ATPase [Pedococcus dokdonensis]|uniref:AAA family ATPase n=1 Tax=Pedococcus dokdonensis TaxID=443156 RepID=UPI0012FD10D9|nr:AAA family ATPase [Pedococcus dokdonensis]
MAEQEASRPFHLVPGLIDASATMLAGRSEGGKSTLLSDLAAAALAGGEFLGRHFTQEVQRVVIVSADLGGPGEYQRRLAARGIEPSTPGHRCALVHFRHPLPHHWNELTGELAPRQGDLVIVDPISFLIPDDGPSINSDEGVRAIWGPLGRWAEAGAAVVAVHHLGNKFGGNGTPMGNSLFTGVARINLRLEKKRGVPVLTTSPNSGAAEELTLDFHPDGFRLVASESAGVASERARSRRAQAHSSRWVPVADWVAANHAASTPAEVARGVAEQFPDLSGAQNPARQIAKWLSERRNLGEYLEQGPGGEWRRTVPLVP